MYLSGMQVQDKGDNSLLYLGLLYCIYIKLEISQVGKQRAYM